MDSADDEKALIEALLKHWHNIALKENKHASPLMSGRSLLEHLRAYYVATASNDRTEISTTCTITFQSYTIDADLSLTDCDISDIKSTDPVIQLGLNLEDRIDSFNMFVPTYRLLCSIWWRQVELNKQGLPVGPGADEKLDSLISKFDHCIYCARALPPTRQRFCTDSCGDSHNKRLSEWKKLNDKELPEKFFKRIDNLSAAIHGQFVELED